MKEDLIARRRQEIIEDLATQYTDYLEDYELEELEEIVESSVFTLREARAEKEKIK